MIGVKMSLKESLYTNTGGVKVKIDHWLHDQKDIGFSSSGEESVAASLHGPAYQ